MEFNQEVREATDPIYQKISKVMPEIEWLVHAPYIHKINKLKKEKNAQLPQQGGFIELSSDDKDEIKEFIGALNSMYTFEKMFSIQLVKQPHYDPEDHFDILRNNWKLDRLAENIEIAQSMCLGPLQIETT